MLKGCYHFPFWCQKVLPLVYDDSLSYYEVLCKLVHYVNKIIKDENSLTELLADLQTDMKTLQEEWQAWSENSDQQQADFEATVNAELEEMQKTLDAIKNGDYVDLYLDSLKAYIDQNLQNMVAGIVKYVVFGLSMDGHFVAYIPQAWEFLNFSTITDPDSDLYNHLVMTW